MKFIFRNIHQVVIRAIAYLQKKLNPKQFLIVASILVGISSGFAAVILKSLAHYINVFIQEYSSNYQDFFLFTLFPLVGITLTIVYLRLFVWRDFFRGSADIVYAIAKKSSIIPQSHMYSHVISSGLTVGFGGSTGLESPLVNAGSAIGSNFGKTYHLSYKDRTMLLACGAAAAIAGAFNSPIAGVLFAIEVLLTDATVSAFVPLMISAATGALFSKIILGEGILLSFTLVRPFDYNNVPYYIALGILAGLVSLYYTRMFVYVEHKVAQIPNSLTRIAIAGAGLAFLLILFPPLFGEGYDSIRALANLDTYAITKNSILNALITNQWLVIGFVMLLLMIKVVATSLTLGSGGNGGNFAPSLCVGAYLGYVFSSVVNATGWGNIPESNFMLVAMAGILSGVFYAPLTAIFLIAEITGGYTLMIPLMIVSALSTVIMKYFEPVSMENKKLAEKMNLDLETRDTYLLSKLDLDNLIETDFVKVPHDAMLRELVQAIKKSSRNMFPVVNAKDELAGIVLLDSVKEMMFDHTLYDKIKVKDVMTTSHATISPNESLNSVLRKFDDTGQWNIPVIESQQYLGFVSKSSILSKYREELVRST